jgi:hypothetical protein
MSSSLPALDERLALKGLLGRGGMGEVHRAWDATLERAVAVKFLRADDEHETERLLLEARLQARVQHRHVVQVLEVGTLRGRPSSSCSSSRDPAWRSSRRRSTSPPRSRSCARPPRGSTQPTGKGSSTAT